MSIENRIGGKLPLLFDGAIGSRLIQMGLPAGKAPEAWILSNPESIRQIHEEYIRAGADVLTTCTFGANRMRLKKGFLDSQITEINSLAVKIAKEGRGEQTFIAGGMGPTGEFFQPHGVLTEKVALETYQEQAELLAAEGIDFFLLETHYDLREALISLTACQKVAPSVPIGVTMTFNKTPKGFFTVMGDPAEESLKRLSSQGAFLVGSNCTLEARGMLEFSRFITERIQTPLLLQANAGTPQLTADGIQYPQTPEEFAECAEKILDLGVRAIGGCCGTNAAHIRSLRQMIDAKFKQRTK